MASKAGQVSQTELEIQCPINCINIDPFNLVFRYFFTKVGGGDSIIRKKRMRFYSYDTVLKKRIVFCLTASKTASKNEVRKTEGNLNQCKKTRVKNEGNAAVLSLKKTSKVCFKVSFFFKKCTSRVHF